MKRILEALIGLVALWAMAACSAGPGATRVEKMDAPRTPEAPGIVKAADLTSQEETLVEEVLHTMLAAMTPESSPGAKDDLAVSDSAMTVTVWVYGQKEYDAAVAIVKSCRRAPRRS